LTLRGCLGAAEWIARVKEEYKALIEYQRVNKEAGA
jgi:hypothetical protein